MRLCVKRDCRHASYQYYGGEAILTRDVRMDGDINENDDSNSGDGGGDDNDDDVNPEHDDDGNNTAM